MTRTLGALAAGLLAGTMLMPAAQAQTTSNGQPGQAAYPPAQTQTMRSTPGTTQPGTQAQTMPNGQTGTQQATQTQGTAPRTQTSNTSSETAQLPQGPYQTSCTDIRRSGDALIGFCRKDDGTSQTAVLANADHCTGTINNDNGQLSCNAASEVGSGSSTPSRPMTGQSGTQAPKP